MTKDAPCKTVAGQELHAGDFAYVGDPQDPATWKLPVHDAAHARNALARFNQTEGIPAGERATVLGKIKAAAKRHGVTVSDETAKGFQIAKVDEAERLVFGWASVAEIEDLQGDVIEPATLEKAAYDFVLHSRNADEMHDGPVKGQMVESLVLTPEKLDKMGLTRTTAPTDTAWWVGFKFEPEAFAKVQSGEYGMFSIAGHAERVEA